MPANIGSVSLGVHTGKLVLMVELITIGGYYYVELLFRAKDL
jgi:hypothetical protein